MLGDSDTSGLGFQLAMYRWMDDMKEARRIREDRTNADSLDTMIAHYNELVGRFNRLWNGCLEASNEFERYKNDANSLIEQRNERIEDLERQLAAAKATERRLLAEAYDLMILRLDRENEREQREAARSQRT